MQLKDKVAVVTGSGRGLYKAIALLFAREGALVTVAARTESRSRFISGTIYETADHMSAEGERALPIPEPLDWAVALITTALQSRS